MTMASYLKTSMISEQASQKSSQNFSIQQSGFQQNVSGGYFEFDDGGCYAGDWVNGQAYGYGKCTGPQGKGEFSGTWKAGFEVSGVYTWPNGNTYAGQWLDGKRGGLGVEVKENWKYKGEWMQGLKEKYGVKYNVTSEAKYEGTWLAGMQDGLGVETYVDESTYQGQWLKGMRHGFGVRKSVPRGIASIYQSTSEYSPNNSLRPSYSMPNGLSLKRNTSSVSSHEALIYGSTLDTRKPDDSDRHKGGFVLIEKIKASLPTSTSQRLQRKFKSDPSNLSGSGDTGKNSLAACSVDVNLASVVETYAGEWKNDKRCGFGISKRTDGLSYEGEWFNDKRCGYGTTFYQDRSREEGKYRNNELISSVDQKRKIFTKKKLKDRVEISLLAAKKAAETAYQKSESAQTMYAYILVY
ncbi:hypothetical protein HELRODRAFT_106997 [Helobdella robusta]|uniref:Junctophilin n=1 Tax=Helobdella robusta TaxID=6412 RepID=T1EE65_HELRO|nr:hypothetical protein HELRODRAFT_106997 [Helobdella robusta]ESN98821.1 hypothetical protein HELRODRAFT_106997 [Helobdella robusta]